jgi:hypothetical protein
MSIHILVLDNQNHQILAAADKRTMQLLWDTRTGEDIYIGKLNDNSTKFYQINDNVYCSEGSICKVNDHFRKEVMKLAHLPASKIIKEARKISRVITPPYGEYLLNSTTLFGIYDDGRLFSWLAERDGSEQLDLCEEGNFKISVHGGRPGTQEAVGAFITDLFKNKATIEEIVNFAIPYASTIDDWISPNYDLMTRSTKNRYDTYEDLSIN